MLPFWELLVTPGSLQGDRGWVWRGGSEAGLTGSIHEGTGQQRDLDLAFPGCNGQVGTEP